MKKLSNSEVILKLKDIYGNKYDYSKVNYLNSRSHIILICPKHGEFSVYANNALLGRGDCAKCKLKFANLEEFIDCARTTHGDKYDYSKVDYINMSTKVTIICSKHGEFLQLPNHHVNGCGCPECSNNKHYTTESWIIKAKEIHKDKYDYSKVEYINNKTKVKITCPVHGEFELLPHIHLTSIGCSKCGIEKRAKTLTLTTEEFIKRAQKVHKNKYNYTKTKYTTSADKVCIICSKHGEFWLIAQDHLLDKGCPKCAYEEIGNKLRLSQEEFEKRAKSRHGNKYTYGTYAGMHVPMEIYCPIHGMFMSTPHNHIVDCGCPKCSESSGETLVRQYLEENNISFKSLHKIKLPKIINGVSLFILDFVVDYNNLKYIIEYNGILHYEYIPFFHKGGMIDLEKQRNRDALLRKLCKLSNITLIEIRYNLSNEEIINLLNNFFKNEQI